jgi:hypothetical protein
MAIIKNGILENSSLLPRLITQDGVPLPYPRSFLQDQLVFAHTRNPLLFFYYLLYVVLPWLLGLGIEVNPPIYLLGVFVILRVCLILAWARDLLGLFLNIGKVSFPFFCLNR